MNQKKHINKIKQVLEENIDDSFVFWEGSSIFNDD